jgi:selenocysteine lyase/cysteine desulfurase
MKDKEWAIRLEGEFPVAERTAFFDIAYENCGAVFHRQAMDEYFADKQDLSPDMIKAGGSGKGRIIEVVRRTRRKLAELIGADTDSIAFTLNTTQGMDAVLQGFPFRKGDRVAVSSMEHVAVLMPVLNLRSKGVEVDVITPENGCYATVEEYLDVLCDDTRMVILSYVQSNCGYRIDALRLMEECHRRGIYVVSDVIQAIGFTELDIRSMPLDAVSACCYKGLLGPEGVGFLYVAPELLSRLRPAYAGASEGTMLDREKMELSFTEGKASRLEAGTLPFAPIYMLEKGLDRLLTIGIKDISSHIRECFFHVRDRLKDIGYDTLFDYTEKNSCHSMLIRVDDAERAYRFFTENGVYVSKSLMDTLRISVAPFTTCRSVDMLLDTARRYLSED